MEIVMSQDIVLKTIQEDEKEDFFNLIQKNQKYLSKWVNGINNIRNPENCLALIQSWASIFTINEGFSFGIYYQDKLVGTVGFYKIELGNHMGEISYWLDEEHQGLGIMTKSCQALIDYAFEELGLNRLEMNIAIGNDKSRGIPERLGFKVEGVHREVELIAGNYLDHVTYALLKREWEGNRS